MHVIGYVLSFDSLILFYMRAHNYLHNSLLYNKI